MSGATVPARNETRFLFIKTTTNNNEQPKKADGINVCGHTVMCPHTKRFWMRLFFDQFTPFVAKNKVCRNKSSEKYPEFEYLHNLLLYFCTCQWMLLMMVILSAKISMTTKTHGNEKIGIKRQMSAHKQKESVKKINFTKLLIYVKKSTNILQFYLQFAARIVKNI